MEMIHNDYHLVVVQMKIVISWHLGIDQHSIIMDAVVM